MATPTNDILNTTLAIRARKLRDNLFRTTPFLDWAKRKGSLVVVDGGARVSLPVGLSEHSTITNLGGGGYNVVSNTVGDVSKDAQYEWCNFSAPVILTKVEQMRNKGPEARVRIIEARTKRVLQNMKEEFEKQVFAGSSSTLTDLTSFFGIDAATGVFEELAFGSQTNTVGGIAKSSYTTAWQHQMGDVAGAFGTNGLTKMREISIKAGTYGAGIDGVFLSTLAYGLYAEELQPQDRFVPERVADGARMRLQFDGAEVYAQKDLGRTGSGGTNKMSGVFLSSDGVKVYVDKEGNFALLPPQGLDQYAAMRWLALASMQVCFDALPVHGVLINAEA